jgi:transposase
MRVAKLAHNNTSEDLLGYMQQSSSLSEFKRWQAIYLTSIGLEAKEIATYTGTPISTVFWWRSVYNHGTSSDAFRYRGAGGRRRAHMSIVEETEFLKKHIDQAREGAILIAGTIKKELEAKLHKSVSLDYVYDLLHRHHWRKVEPEHHHPKQNIPAQEEFKKNFLNTSQRRWVKISMSRRGKQLL